MKCKLIKIANIFQDIINMIKLRYQLRGSILCTFINKDGTEEAKLLKMKELNNKYNIVNKKYFNN